MPDPRIALAAVLALLLSVVTLPAHHLTALLGHLGLAAGLLALFGIAPRALGRRLLVVAPLLAGVVLASPALAPEGPVVLQIGGLELTEGPLLTVHAVLVKTLVAVSLLTVLGERLSMARLLEGLRGLGLPPSATLEAGLTWRYAGLVEREARALRRAVAARGWRPRWLLQAGLLGRLVASLFLRSVQRGERVHRAMLARGADRAAPAAARGALPPAQLAGAALLLVAALAMRGLP